MDQVTQQNAAMVEQTTAAAANLDRSARPGPAVAHFETGSGVARAATPSRAPAPRASNPALTQARGRIAGLARPGGGQASAAAVATEWEEF
jgi:methyl-accepting chemotaxis protein